MLVAERSEDPDPRTRPVDGVALLSSGTGTIEASEHLGRRLARGLIEGEVPVGGGGACFGLQFEALGAAEAVVAITSSRCGSSYHSLNASSRPGTGLLITSTR